MTVRVFIALFVYVHLIFIFAQNETDEIFADRVHEIIRRDSNKDPATNPHALLAKVLIDEVILPFLTLMFGLSTFFRCERNYEEDKPSSHILKLDGLSFFF
jgi:hypothetical protein